jgi:hypothetical protein
MPRKGRNCADCRESLEWTARADDLERWPILAYCQACRVNYDSCSRCGELRHLRDMRQVWCVDCRREYDRDRWARQRAARGGRS